MIDGYLLTICSGSALDETVKNFTLFNLVENITVPSEALGQVVPLELHFHFFVAPEGRSTNFQMRLVRVAEGGVAEAGGELKFRTGDAPRFRLKAGAFRLPMAFGEYRLHMDWRREGEETWHEDHQVWPLSLKQPPEATGPDTPAADDSAASIP